MKETYLESTIKVFSYYKLLGEKTFDQLEDSQLLWQYNQESNSIVTIVKHLSGNMLSRWTDLLTSDGEKEWRDRDAEFENETLSREQMMQLWEKGWNALFTALRALKPEDLDKTIYIRNEGHSVLEAINRQIAHYAYHVGQIVYAGKMSAQNWNSLSIPKRASKQFNDEKFSKPKHLEHYTDAYLKKQ